MSDAVDKPVTRKYKRSFQSTDHEITQKDDIDLDLSATMQHGEALPDISGDAELNRELLAALAFNEEPVTIIIEENSRSELPETHVPVYVNGKPAEVMINGQWVPMGWLPVSQEITTRRKYVELLLRSKSDHINTIHDDATVEKPRNTIRRRTNANYPVTILHDANPKGREWVTRVMAGF